MIFFKEKNKNIKMIQRKKVECYNKDKDRVKISIY